MERPGSSIADDTLLLVMRNGARRDMQQVIEAEVEAFHGAHDELENARARRRVIRNGQAPERVIQTDLVAPIEFPPPAPCVANYFSQPIEDFKFRVARQSKTPRTKLPLEPLHQHCTQPQS